MQEHGKHHRHHEDERECGRGHFEGHHHPRHGEECGREERVERHHHYRHDGGCGCGHHGEQTEHHHGEWHCGCGCGSWDSRMTFRRRFQTREERVAWLREYLKDLQAEAQAVEERIVELSAAG